MLHHHSSSIVNDDARRKIEGPYRTLLRRNRISHSPVFREHSLVVAAQSRWVAFHVWAGVVAGGSTTHGYGVHAVES